jgi:hypothetical protein
VTPSALTEALGGPAESVQLAMLAGRPVYRMRRSGYVVTAFADDGHPLGMFGADDALNEVKRFAPEHASTLRYDGFLADPDQWTLEISRQLPMHRVALGDGEDTRIYVSASSGEVLLETTASTRMWAYPGAIVHWIYLTPIRRHGAVWAQFIIWTSVAGTVLSVVGLAWGLWRYSPHAIYRMRRTRSHSPYAGWMWWHHYAGLIFGVATVTWIFSGLLSMDPWDWHPSTSPTSEQRLAFSGGPLSLDGLTVDALEKALAQMPGARAADIIRSEGRLWLAADRGVAPLEDGAARLPLDGESARTLAERAIPGAAVADIARLSAYDGYYYDRGRELPLPVLRIRSADRVETWLYVDPARGIVLRKEERLTRLNRWLYHGLHSLDFPFLYNRRPLWDIVVVALSIGGLLLTVAAVSPAWRRLRRHIGRLTRHDAI